MIPKPGMVLEALAQRIVTHQLPAAGTAYAQADAAILAGLLATLAQDYERSAASRVADIEDIRALLDHVLGTWPGSDLNAQLLKEQPASIHLQDLTPVHDLALQTLIDIQTWAELTENEEITLAAWRVLHAHLDRHRVDIPGP